MGLKECSEVVDIANFAVNGMMFQAPASGGNQAAQARDGFGLSCHTYRMPQAMNWAYLILLTTLRTLCALF